MITYNSKLIGNQDDLESLKEILLFEQIAFNEASKIQFLEKKKSIVILHSKFYQKLRLSNPEIPSQVLIRGEQACLSAYRSIKSNKHKIDKPIQKKNLSIRLDKRLYSKNKDDKHSINITTSNKRKKFKFVLYEKLKTLFDKFDYCDPLLFINQKGFLCISFSFENKIEKIKQKLCLGVDLGVRVSAACSDGRVIIDKKFNKEKRQLRYLKRKLQSKSKVSKSAKRHLKKLRRKERNKNKNQTHLIANTILKTKADTIALENLKGIKAKKNKYQNKNKISQVPLFELRRILTYKAENTGKTVILVNPYLTSQIDSVTGKHEGERKGRRFYAVNGLIYDSDLNASVNIAKKSKLPVSCGNILDGQAIVTLPNVDGSHSQAPEFIRG